MNADNDESTPRLDVIETQWHLLRRAHQGTINTGNEARRELVLRYSTAIRSFVKAITRNPEEADEISQDVVVRLLQGDFAGADPQRGRFRDLLKCAVRNMVRNHWEKQGRRKGVDLDVERMELAEDEQEDETWLAPWRKNVLNLAWAALEEYQRQSPGSIAHTVLRLRADHPKLGSTELAERLSAELGREVRSDALRQQLRRARVRFAECVVNEVAQGLADASRERIQEELISLGIYEHVKAVLPQEWSVRESGGEASDEHG